MAVGVFSCTRGEAADADAPYKSPYDWSHLTWTGDRLSYDDGHVVSRLGVDVSDHQGDIDWASVAADGIDFAMVRLGYRGYTEGALNEDARATTNIDAAQRAGLDVGAYFFSQATSAEEAREEAEFVLSILDGRALELPVAFDHEPIVGATGRANDVDGAVLAECASLFCETLEGAGYSTMVYGNRQDLERFVEAGGTQLDGSAGAARTLEEELGERPIWFAEYGVATPTAPLTFAIWQYTNLGTVAGISTTVDMNLMLGM